MKPTDASMKRLTNDHVSGGLQFPCTFPIKAIGLASADFDVFVLEIVRRHCVLRRENPMHSKHSRAAKYTAVTVTVEAESQSQLDALYRELSSNDRIMMVL